MCSFVCILFSQLFGFIRNKYKMFVLFVFKFLSDFFFMISFVNRLKFFWIIIIITVSCVCNIFCIFDDVTLSWTVPRIILTAVFALIQLMHCTHQIINKSDVSLWLCIIYTFAACYVTENTAVHKNGQVLEVYLAIPEIWAGYVDLKKVACTFCIMFLHVLQIWVILFL